MDWSRCGGGGEGGVGFMAGVLEGGGKGLLFMAGALEGGASASGAGEGGGGR